MDAIKITNLTKSYGKNRGIVNLNLTVKQGEFFGFIGPNGAGKSTTIRTLLGLIKSNSGSGKIFGMDIEKDKIELLKSVGYLPSEASFYSKMRVSDAINFSAELYKENCVEEATELCRRLQLDVTKKIDELSFGNRKKVAIVCALQHNPKLLILDEPTSGLDPLIQKEFFDILRERNNNGVTIFLSSHVLSEIQRNCSKAAIIRQGEIVACGSVEELSKTSAKKVTVQGDIDLSQLNNIRNIQKSADMVSFLYSGDVNELISVVSKTPVSDLIISEPDLDEVFMHYYEEGENDHI